MMERRRRYASNLVLLVMAIVLGLLAWFEPGSDTPSEAPQLIDLASEEVEQITIERRGKAALRLEKRDDGWRLREPFDLPANLYRVASLLRLTEARSLGSHPAEGRDLKPFGLAPPQATVTLNESITIAFGDPTPLDNRRYLLIGDRFHLSSDSLYYQLVGEATGFVDLRLLPEGKRITAISLPNRSLKRLDQGWRVDPEPEGYSADQAVSLIERWRHARALEVKRLAVTDGAPVTIELEGGETLVYHIVSEEPDLVLARPDLGIAYTLAGSEAPALLSLAAVTGAGDVTPAAEASPAGEKGD